MVDPGILEVTFFFPAIFLFDKIRKCLLMKMSNCSKDVQQTQALSLVLTWEPSPQPLPGLRTLDVQWHG